MELKSKKALFTGLALIGFVALSSTFFLQKQSTANQEPKVIKFVAAHGPYELIMKPLQAFKDTVEKETQGRVKVEVVVQDGVDDVNIEKMQEALAGVESGKYQMSQLYASDLASIEKNLYALEVPFLFRDHDHSFATVDGEIGKELLAGLETKSDLKGLGFTYCGGYRIVVTKDKKIQTLNDLKGLTLATGTPMSSAILKSLGVVPQRKLQKGEIRKLVDQEKIDGNVSVYPRYFYNNEYKIAPIANELFFNIQYTILVMNKQFFNSLREEDQKVIQDAAQVASLQERHTAISIAEDVNKNAKKYGIKIVQFKDQKKVIEHFKNSNWEEKLGITKGFVDRIRNVENKTKQPTVAQITK